MSPPHQNEEDLFAAALKLPAAERAPFLERACGGDADLRGRVEALLAASEAAGDFLQEPAAGARPADECPGNQLRQESVGERIGRYKLLQRIGEGGFGTVWMAEQEEPVLRRVALKVLKAGLDTKEVVARFESERQALALMDHPNIARVFDGGATDGGRPFFVMELVRGMPITTYCDEHRLPADERLELFIKVCQAVQHAHQKGVIHRDLKPSNILVTLHDDVAVPKVIDFGIAKAIEGRLTDKTLVTQFHAFIGTPVYSSPEQVEMSALDVDTRSDIYSLGVLLYELLTGRPPFDPDTLAKAGLESMRRTIREVDPPRPSARLGTLTDEDRTSVARQRGTDPRALSTLLQGDLDWIVMRCLEKNRTRRYETANGLAMDIQRHLDHELVVARPPSVGYRLRKFAVRNRVSVAAGTVVALSLVGALLVSFVLLVRERKAHQREIEARQQAAAAEKAESRLRREAEESRAEAVRRATVTGMALAEQLFAEGRSCEAVANLVRVARMDPANRIVGPRLVSALASRNFLLPEVAPVRLGSRVYAKYFSADGRKLTYICTDGAVAIVDVQTGAVRQGRLPSPPALECHPAAGGAMLAFLCQDGVVRVVDADVGPAAREVRFEMRVRWAVGGGFYPGRVPADWPVTDLSTTEWPRKSGRASESSEPFMVVRLEDRSWFMVSIRRGTRWPLPAQADGSMLIFSDDGRWLVLGIVDQGMEVLEIWDVPGGRKCRTLPLPGVMRFDINPDGNSLVTVAPASTGGGDVLQVWSLPDCTPVSRPQRVENVLGSDPYRVYTRRSRDGRWLAAITRAGLQVHEVASGARVGPFLPEPGNPSPTVVFSPDGRRLLSAASTGVRIWDIEAGRPLALPMPDAGVLAAVFGDDGSVVQITSTDGFTRLWDPATGRLFAEPVFFQSIDADAAISPDGGRLFVVSAGGVLRQMRVSSAGFRPLILPRGKPAQPVPFLPGLPARLLWMTDVWAKELDVASGGMRRAPCMFPEPVAGNFYRWVSGCNLALSPDGHTMVVRTAANGWQAWELPEGGIARKFALEDAPGRDGWVRFSPDGRRVVVIAIAASIVEQEARIVRVWDVQTGKLAGPPLVHDAAINVNYIPASFSPDERRIAVGTSSGVAVWEIAHGEALMHLRLSHATIEAVEYSPDGTRIVASDNDGSMRMWNADTGEPIGRVLEHRGAFREPPFSPDGRYLLTTETGNGSGHVLDGRDGVALNQSGGAVSNIMAAAFDPTARCFLATGNGGFARLFDTESGRPLSEPMAHGADAVMAPAFSPDGRFVRTETVDLARGVGQTWLWPVPPDAGEVPTPDWLLDLATLCAGGMIDAHGRFAAVAEAGQSIDDIRRTLADLPDDAPFVEWGRWIVADRDTRSIAPGFTITPAEAEKLAAELGAGDD